jgi:hypothetical protein
MKAQEEVEVQLQAFLLQTVHETPGLHSTQQITNILMNKITVYPVKHEKQSLTNKKPKIKQEKNEY